MESEIKELATYRLNRAFETLEVAKTLLVNGKYKDANNRSYYAVFYGIKAVYALEGRDFKKHKTLLANFNKEYVATQIFPREFGKRISALALIREQSDYNDFYIASKQESQQQVDTAEGLLAEIKQYLQRQ